ncbi:hypothetical protein Sjap_017245 [Stephania japonica]|uniref:Uncharacterized protein n=1 Tax=Stephania japonica TaxID=461633 RepID=A0AAP0I5W5_9MAGN
MDDSEGYCWKSVPPHHKDQCGDNGRWDDALPEDLVRRRTTGLQHKVHALMHKLKKNRVRQFMLRDEAWRRYLRSGERGLRARSGKRRENRNTEVEGPGTGPSKHGGGSVSFATTQERLVVEHGLGHLPFTEKQFLHWKSMIPPCFLGVEDVEADCKAHKVIVKGKQADPLKVLERVRKKSHRQVELLSQIPKPPSLKKRRKQRKRSPN